MLYGSSTGIVLADGFPVRGSIGVSELPMSFVT